MKFSVVEEIPFERELVFTTLRDKLVELVAYLPNVDKIEMPVRREADGVVQYENVWHGAAADIPAVARSVIKPDMLRWVDFAKWDQNVWECHWDIHLLALPGAITAKGVNRYRDEGDATVIELAGDFSLHPDKIPGVPAFAARTVAPALERFVIGQLSPNLRQTVRAAQQYIEDNL